MAIRFLCPSCCKRLRAAASDAGRQIVCPKCATPLAVPASSTAAAVDAPQSEVTSAPSTPVNPFESPKEIYVPGSSAGFATEDELPPDPEIRARVFAPAVALMAVGLCGLLLRVAGTFRHLFGITLPESAAGAERLL